VGLVCGMVLELSDSLWFAAIGSAGGCSLSGFYLGLGTEPISATWGPQRLEIICCEGGVAVGAHWGSLWPQCAGVGGEMRLGLQAENVCSMCFVVSGGVLSSGWGAQGLRSI